MGSFKDAQKAFKKKFSDKTKNKWETRDSFQAVPGKYTLIEMDEEGEDDEVRAYLTLELRVNLAALGG